MNLVIAGIHTGIGKTVCSAVLTEALQYDYWKPVQAGELEATDSMFVANHISNYLSQIHKEAYRLKLAASPHWAAREEKIEIEIEKLNPPVNERLIIETAGGIMSPLNETQTNLHLVLHLQLPVIIVCSDYLGSINHSLLTIEVLKSHGVKIIGLVFSGNEVKTTREYICRYSGLPVLFSIPHFENMNGKSISGFAASISEELKTTIDEFK
jgi:dethiobiotin synthetase